MTGRRLFWHNPTLFFFCAFQKYVVKSSKLEFIDKCQNLMAFWSFLGSDPLNMRLKVEFQAERVRDLIRYVMRKKCSCIIEIIAWLIEILITECISCLLWIQSGLRTPLMKSKVDFWKLWLMPKTWPKSVKFMQPFVLWKIVILILGLHRFSKISCQGI